MEFVNQPGRFGVLATASPSGASNAAVFGSARMTDETTLELGLGDNRTLENLRRNPRATFLVFEPGATPLSWQGVRLYLEVIEITANGPRFEAIVAGVREQAGPLAARAIRTLVVFRITASRPLLDAPRRTRRRTDDPPEARHDSS
jgi:hypothetical protein